jgi:hypothetical protein
MRRVTEDEAIALLLAAGMGTGDDDDEMLPVRRIEICRRLIAYFADTAAQRPGLHWNTPIRGLAEHDEEAPLWLLSTIEEHVFGLTPLNEGARELATFGDIVLHIEGRLRELWWSERVGNCHSQAIFYELRRTIEEQIGDGRRRERLRPSTPLRVCLPAVEAETVQRILQRRFGAKRLPIEKRVLGVTVLETGATWLALWFPCFFFWLVSCAGPGVVPPWCLAAGFLIPPILLAAFLALLSRETWIGLCTLGDLTRWALRQNRATTRRLERASAQWA